MRHKKFLVLFIVLYLAAGLCFAQEKSNKKQKEPTGKSTEAGPVKSLIKKELLSKKTSTLKPPKRNIFSASQHYNPEVRPENEGFSKKDTVDETFPGIADDMMEDLFEVAYIGYIVSGSKITALIVFEEETLAVQEGEMITPLMRVTEVSSQYIEVIGPDEKKRKFYLVLL